MNQDLNTFYTLTRRTREGVLDWLESLPEDVFTCKHEDFAYGSLCAIYAHIADTYLWWVGTVGLAGDESKVEVSDVDGLRHVFDKADATVLEALETFTDLDDPFTWTSPSGQSSTLTQRWLLLHTVTHGFHHKGQALALARALGHPHPGKPDTDLVNP